MPEKLERELKARAEKKGLSEERKNAYVYGTLRATGWKPSREKKKEKKMSDPTKSIDFASVASYWKGGALRTGKRPLIELPENTARIYLPDFLSKKSTLGALGGGYKQDPSYYTPKRLIQRVRFSSDPKLIRLSHINNELGKVIEFAAVGEGFGALESVLKRTLPKSAGAAERAGGGLAREGFELSRTGSIAPRVPEGSELAKTATAKSPDWFTPAAGGRTPLPTAIRAPAAYEYSGASMITKPPTPGAIPTGPFSGMRRTALLGSPTGGGIAGFPAPSTGGGIAAMGGGKLSITDRLKGMGRVGWGLTGAGLGIGAGVGAGAFLNSGDNRRYMSSRSKVIRLAAINSRLDKVIEFRRDDDHPIERAAGIAAITGTAGTAGAAGLYALGRRSQGIPESGGQMTLPGLGTPTVRETASQLGTDISNIGKGGGAQIGRTIGEGALLAGQKLKGWGSKSLSWLRNFRFDAKQQRLIQLNKELDKVINFGGNPADPTAGMFGGNDPGILAQEQTDNAQSSALQRLKIKIAQLRGMGLFNY